MSKAAKNSEKLAQKRIKDLCSDDFNFHMICVIISKTDPRFFLKNELEFKGVLTLTIRDSLVDTQNVTIWGQEDLIREYDDRLRIGDVINILKPKIVALCNEKSINLMPKTSSPFYLQIDERRGKIEETNSDYSATVKGYLRHPLKDVPLQLADVSTYTDGTLENSIYVDLLVALRYARPIKEFLNDKGEVRHSRNLAVMDKSNPSMMFQLWSTQLTRRSEAWTPGNTVLYISDVRVKYNDFFDAMVLVETPKTIIIEDPIGKDAEELANYVASVPLDNDSLFGSHFVECKYTFCIV